MVLCIPRQCRPRTYDVVVIYKAIRPSCSVGIFVFFVFRGDFALSEDSDQAVLEAFVKRGGGLVSFHDSLWRPGSAYFATSWWRKETWRSELHPGRAHPLHGRGQIESHHEGHVDITISDEAFFTMTWAKDSRDPRAGNRKDPANAQSGNHKDEVVPQIWTYEHALPVVSRPGVRVDAGPHLPNFANNRFRRCCSVASHGPEEAGR